MELFTVGPTTSSLDPVKPLAALTRASNVGLQGSSVFAQAAYNCRVLLKQKAFGFSLSLPPRTFLFGDRKLVHWQGAASGFDRAPYPAFFFVASKDGNAGMIGGTAGGRILGSTVSSVPDDPGALEAALVAAETRALAAEQASRDALEALSISEAKVQEYSAIMVQATEQIMAGLDVSKKLFKSELEKMLAEKSLELLLAKQDAVDLALSVEKIADFAIHEATHDMCGNARLKAIAAETAAAEASLRVQESIRHATADAAGQVIKEASKAMAKAKAAAVLALEQASRAQEARAEHMELLDELAVSKSLILSLEGKISLLEQQLIVSEDRVEKLRVELAASRVSLDAAVARVADAEATIRQVQKAAQNIALEQDESMKRYLEKIKATAVARVELVNSAVSADLEALKSAYFTAHEAEIAKKQANLRWCETLERSLAAAEATAKAWKRRSTLVESFLQRAKEEKSGAFASVKVEEIISGGRMEALLGKDSRRWDLLANGPRREIPEWMKWRIELGLQGLPPRSPLPITSEIQAELPLYLPSPEEVWSISSAKIKEDDLFTKQAVEKEALDEQRRALERALQKRTAKRHPEDREGKQEIGTGSGQEIVFQGFNWESWRRKWYLELAPKAADLSKCGITTIWLPPPTQSVSPQGYMPGDLYNLNSAYGTMDELKQCIEEMHRNGILVLGDAVLNHRCAQKQGANGIWNIFGGKLAWGPEAIVKDDPNFQGQGNPSSGDFFHAAPNIDHSQDFVRRDIIGWMKWLRSDIGFDGWRLDFVRGFWGGYVKEYIEATNPVFSIGEYWDSLAYEGGQVCYNQDAHRQRIINWINATGGTSSAFDVTTKGILHSALHNEFWRLIDPQGKPPGVMGWWPSRAVTFLENHDTGSTQGHWPFPREKLMQGYAYVLTHPGTPVIFYDHFYDFGLHDQIAELIAARKRTGVHCRSPVKIFHANFDGYVAQIGDKLLMKLGRLDWNPSKENNLVGSWERFLDQGTDFQLWERR